ncbi:hypothetical protein [Paenibacillus sp. FSL K6-2859]
MKKQWIATLIMMAFVLVLIPPTTGSAMSVNKIDQELLKVTAARS